MKTKHRIKSKNTKILPKLKTQTKLSAKTIISKHFLFPSFEPMRKKLKPNVVCSLAFTRLPPLHNGRLKSLAFTVSSWSENACWLKMLTKNAKSSASRVALSLSLGPFFKAFPPWSPLVDINAFSSESGLSK